MLFYYSVIQLKYEWDILFRISAGSTEDMYSEWISESLRGDVTSKSTSSLVTDLYKGEKAKTVNWHLHTQVCVFNSSTTPNIVTSIPMFK